MLDGNVRQRQGSLHMAQEARSLGATLDQRERSLGLGDRQRNSRKPGPAADIGDTLADQKAAKCETLKSLPLMLWPNLRPQVLTQRQYTNIC